MPVDIEKDWLALGRLRSALLPASNPLSTAPANDDAGLTATTRRSVVRDVLEFLDGATDEDVRAEAFRLLLEYRAEVTEILVDEDPTLNLYTLVYAIRALAPLIHESHAADSSDTSYDDLMGALQECWISNLPAAAVLALVRISGHLKVPLSDAKMQEIVEILGS